MVAGKTKFDSPTDRLAVDFRQSCPGGVPRVAALPGQAPRASALPDPVSSGAEAGSGGAGVPCLLVITQPTGHGQRARIARRAETLYANLSALIERVGIDRCGLFTCTFPDNCSIRAESEKRFNSFASHFLRNIFTEHVVVPERQERGAFHHHLAVACHVDIRTGFDFDGCSAANDFKKEHIQKISGRWRWDSEANEQSFIVMSRLWYRSANPHLKKLWRQIREAAPRYHFGRCELLPILSNAQGCARYLGSYVNAQHNRREDEDKGMRTVRYALLDRPWSAQWAFVKGGAKSWRTGCAVLARLLGGLRDFAVPFGKRWAFHLAPFVFIASRHEEELLIDAEAIPFGMTWQRRLILVRRLLGRFEDELEGDFDLQQCEDHFISSKPHHLPV